MNERLILPLVATAALFASSGARAENPPPRAGLLVQTDLEFGGDTQNVHAGQGLSFGVGGYFRPNPTGPFEIDALLGFKYLTTAASNADINISRTVVKLNGDGFFEDVPFDAATGFSAEVGWRWIALRYTNIEYTNDFIEDVDASSLGLSFTWRFRSRRGY